MPSLADIAKMDTKDIDFGSLLSGLRPRGRRRGEHAPLRSRRKSGGGTLVGLDIQPGWVTAVQASVSGVVSVERAAGVFLPPDVVRDGEVMDEGLLTEALRELFRDGTLNRRVRVGLANQRSVVRVMELPPITDRKELEAAVAFQAADQIPMPLHTAVLDFHPLGIVDTPSGKRQRVAVVAAQQEMVERLVRSVTAAGLRPVAVDLSAFAMIRALHRQAAAMASEDGAGRAAETVSSGGESVVEGVSGAAGNVPDGVSGGGESALDGVSGGGGEAKALARTLYLNVGGLTNLAIAEGVTCRFTRTVGGGLESMAAQLAERQAIPLTQARAAIAAVDLLDGGEAGAARKAPSAAAPAGSGEPAVEPGAEGESAQGDQEQAEAAAQPIEPRAEDPLSSEAKLIMRSVLRDIAGEIRNSIDFHRAQESGNVVDSVVMSGSALEISGFSEALEAELGHAVSRRIVALSGGSELHGVPVERLTIAAGLAVEEVPE